MKRQPHTTLTRRDFLKASALGAAAVCGRYISAQLSAEQGDAAPRWVATYSGMGAAGGALRLTVADGRVLTVEPNLAHPCGANVDGQVLENLLSDLRNARRLTTPLERRGGRLSEIDWRRGVRRIAQSLLGLRPHEIAFVLGVFPDHLNDLVRLLAQALGGASVVRFDPYSLTDSRLTLMDAARSLYGLSQLPYFALDQAQVVFSFGLTGCEPWLTPRWIAALQASDALRLPGEYWVQFEARRSPLAARADEWVRIRPGSEVLLASALNTLTRQNAQLAQEAAFDLQAVGRACGVSLDDLQHLARRFAAAQGALAIPGASALAQPEGVEAARAILELNQLRESSATLFFSPLPPLYPHLLARPSTFAEVAALIERMRSGQIKALFVHGVDLFASLPASLETERALQQVPFVVSFASSLNETARHADLILPDRSPLESWGYQRTPAADRPAVAAVQPVFPPSSDGLSTADVLLAAAHQAGDKLADLLPFRSELDFIRQAVADLPWSPGPDGWARWLAQGGWWTEQSILFPPISRANAGRFAARVSSPASQGFQFVVAPWPGLSAGEAEWQVEMHPQAAAGLGLRSGDVIRLALSNASRASPTDGSGTSLSGEIELPLVLQSAMHPQALALQPAPGGRRIPRSELLAFLGQAQNSAGDWAFQGGEVRVD